MSSNPRKMLLPLLVLLGLTIPLVLAGCDLSLGGSTSGTGAKNNKQRFKVGFANLTEDIPYTIKVREGIQRAAAQAGNVELLFADNALDGTVAVTNTKYFITNEVDGVIQFQVDASRDQEIMDMFREKDIPVIAIDMPMPGAVLFTIDNERAGFLSGEGLGNWIKANWGGKIDALFILEIAGAGVIPETRINSAREGLESVIGKIDESMVPVKRIDTEGTADKALREVGAALTEMPDARNVAILAVNDDTALGAANAAELAKRKEHVAVAGQGGDLRAREEIRREGSVLVGCTMYGPEKYGDKIIPAMLKLLRGEDVESPIRAEHVFLTKENIDQHYPNDTKPGS